MSDVNRKIIENLNSKPVSGMVIKLDNLLNNNKRYPSKICVVEGGSDPKFYKNLRGYNLDYDTEYIFNNRNKKEKEYVGKDSVINCFELIKNKSKYSSLLSKVIFIVDHDFDGAKSFEIEYDNKDKRENYFTITSGYSFENYYLKQNNLKVVFNHFKLNDSDLERFTKLFNVFLQETKEFYILRSVTLLMKKQKTSIYSPEYKIYKNKYKFNDIFKFNFNNKQTYFKEKLMYEVNSMKNFLKQPENKIALNYYYNLLLNLNYNSNFIRGHDVYNFLVAYLRDVHKIPVYKNKSKYTNDFYYELYNSDNKKIVAKFVVDLNVKNALGENLVYNK